VKGRAFLLADGRITPIPCGLNRCVWCRRVNVMVTAAMLGTDALESPPRLAITTTTRDWWIDDATLREGTRQFARTIRRDVSPAFEYAWLREWTTGFGPRADGRRRTHKHWLAKHVEPTQVDAILGVARDVWGRVAGATEHFVQEVWNAGGIARYVAGLAGHHLKESQAPPPGWIGRRFGTSRRYFVRLAAELRREAEVAVRDERLRVRLETAMREAFEASGPLSGEEMDAALTRAVERVRQAPKPRLVEVPGLYWQMTPQDRFRWRFARGSVVDARTR
jgi:hypothetical protein